MLSWAAKTAKAAAVFVQLTSAKQWPEGGCAAEQPHENVMLLQVGQGVLSRGNRQSLEEGDDVPAMAEAGVAACSFAFAGVLDSVFYNGVDVTEHVGGDSLAERTLSMAVVPGAYLVVTGQDTSSDSDRWSTGGLRVECEGKVDNAYHWESLASDHPLDATHRAGEGSDWSLPAVLVSGLALDAPQSSRRVLMSRGRHIAFRAQLEATMKASLAATEHSLGTHRDLIGERAREDTGSVDRICETTDFEDAAANAMGSVSENPAQLLQTWCDLRRDAQSNADIADRINLASRKHVVWWHLHNFGGTTICQEALRQGEVVPPFASFSLANCNIPWDGCQGWPTRTFCLERAHWGFSTTFTMIERDADPRDFCDEVLDGTTLREPIAAMRSTLLNNNYDKVNLFQVLRGEMPPDHHVDHTGCLPDWDTFQHFDNFATRTFGDAYRLEPGAVTREHLNIAKDRLRNMEVVMILEELAEHVVQLEAFFNWDVSEMDVARKYNNHTTTDAFSDDEEAYLRQINALDYELYEFGRGLASSRSATANMA